MYIYTYAHIFICAYMFLYISKLNDSKDMKMAEEELILINLIRYLYSPLNSIVLFECGFILFVNVCFFFLLKIYKRCKCVFQILGEQLKKVKTGV